MTQPNIPERQGTYIKIATYHRNVAKAGGYRQWIDKLTWQLYPRHRINWTAKGDPIPAIIARNNWAVVCPYCNDAFLYEPGFDFFCRTCLMQGNDGQAQPVAMPANRVALETTLELRPNPFTRNWIPGETVEDLRNENARRGIGNTFRVQGDN